MKNLIILFISIFVLSSCDVYGPDEDRERFGFDFRITNNTGVEYLNAEITIGIMKDGVFVPSETLKLPVIPRSKNVNGSTYYFLSGDRWQPNLKNIEKAYFKLKLNSEREGFIEFLENKFVSNTPLLMYLKIPENKIITNRGDDSVSRIFIAIWEDNVLF